MPNLRQPYRQQKEGRMPVKKKNPRCYVVSMRVSDEERSILEELTRRSRQSMSNLLREAMQRYAPAWENNANQR